MCFAITSHMMDGWMMLAGKAGRSAGWSVVPMTTHSHSHAPTHLHAYIGIFHENCPLTILNNGTSKLTRQETTAKLQDPLTGGIRQATANDCIITHSYSQSRETDIMSRPPPPRAPPPTDPPIRDVKPHSFALKVSTYCCCLPGIGLSFPFFSLSFFPHPLPT